MRPDPDSEEIKETQADPRVLSNDGRPDSPDNGAISNADAGDESTLNLPSETTTNPEISRRSAGLRLGTRPTRGHCYPCCVAYL